MLNIAIYGSHNAAVAVEKDGEIILNLELERWLNEKNQGLSQYKTVKSKDLLELTDILISYVMHLCGVKKFGVCYYQHTDVIMDEVKYELHERIPALAYVECGHHESHAGGTFYQSPYERALIFSFDGGGNDGVFNIYEGIRGESVKLVRKINNPNLNSPHKFLDLGFPYMSFGEFLGDIQKEDLSTGNLVYPGKIMGLVGFGEVKEEWLDRFKEYYLNDFDGDNMYAFAKKLGDDIGVEFNIDERLFGQVAYDIAATSQRVFENLFFDVLTNESINYPNHGICITGGCALNIILNTKVEKLYDNVFVPPNPNDCGLAVGMLLNKCIKPMIPVDLTYSGMDLMDRNIIPEYIQNGHYFTTHGLDIFDVAKDLNDGKIIGLVRGKSEHGPRALGNRTILCHPKFPNMKDILNAKVKHREWFRPFSPVVRLEDVSTYFEYYKESRWMSFCPKVKEEWIKKIPAVVHADGTARVQTVTEEQNDFLYFLLCALEQGGSTPILLNTSFNVQGKPILNTARDAFKIFHESEMDGLIIDNYYFKK